MPRFLMIFAAMLVAPSITVPSLASASDCDSPHPDWLMCEDFEGAPSGWSEWFASSGFVECRGCSDGVNNPSRLYLSDDADHVFDGNWAMHMPAEADAGYRGAELIYHSCLGEGRPGCELENYDRLYLRTRVKLAPDHEYVHHFLSIGGSQPDAYWDGSGNAGCRPNGMRAASTTLDFSRDRNLWFYTYHPDMRCDSGGYCSGEYAQNICNGCAERGMACGDTQECCWGNRFEPTTPRTMPRDEWVCLEVMMKINTPGEADGEMAFWFNDELAHQETGMQWRDVQALGLNRANMSHYIAGEDADRPNRVSFDDFIVSTSPIGCDVSPAPLGDAGPGRDAGPGFDAGPLADAGPARDASASGSDGAVRDAQGSDAGDAGPTAGGEGCSVHRAGRLSWGTLAFCLGWVALGLRRRRGEV